MSLTLFFSWQSDLPGRTGRNLIDKALHRALGMLKADFEVDEAVRGDIAVDRDTLNVPGTPAVVDTIFQKIGSASMFLPDLTFVGSRRNGRPTPNPNVLIEYGYALRALGHGRMIPVMNTAYGEPGPTTLPFDMIHLRHPITFHCPEDADEDVRRAAREGLERDLLRAIKLIVGAPEFRPALPSPPAPPAFLRREPKDGAARFRAKGEPLGIVHEPERLETTFGNIILSDGSPSWLRVMPDVDPGRNWKWAELKRAGVKAVPIGWSGGSVTELRAEDGFALANITGFGGVAESVTMLFDTGEIWSVDARITDRADRRHLPLDEHGFSEALRRFTKAARRLGMEGPFRWVAGMSGVGGRCLTTPLGDDLAGASVVDEIVVEGNHAQDADASASLEPFFEAVFDRCGMERAAWVQRRNALPRRPSVSVSIIDDDDSIQAND